MHVPLCEIFEACLTNFLPFPELYFFTFHSQYWAIFRTKRTRGRKKNSHFREKNFREDNTEALVILKAQVPLG